MTVSGGEGAETVLNRSGFGVTSFFFLQVCEQWCQLPSPAVGVRNSSFNTPVVENRRWSCHQLSSNIVKRLMRTIFQVRIHIKCTFNNKWKVASGISWSKATQIWTGILVHFFLSSPSSQTPTPPELFSFHLYFLFSHPAPHLCQHVQHEGVEARERKGWNKWAYVPLLECERWRKRGQGGFKSSSGLWWKAKIKLPAAAISAVWLSTHLFFFSLHTSPNHLLFPLRHCMCTCTASEFYYFINFSHSMGESRAGRHVHTSTFFWSLSQKKSIPTGRGSGVSACGGARNRARGGTTAVVVANLNHRYRFQSLLLGGTTDKSIITLNRGGGGSLDVLRCQGPWKSSRSTCPFTPFFISSCRAHAKWSS